jgi:hypothetical protein
LIQPSPETFHLSFESLVRTGGRWASSRYAKPNGLIDALYSTEIAERNRLLATHHDAVFGAEPWLGGGALLSTAQILTA